MTHKHVLFPMYTAHGHTYADDRQWFYVEFACSGDDCDYEEIDVAEVGEA